MKKSLFCAALLAALICALCLSGCGGDAPSGAVLTSTKPIYDLTLAITEGTGVPVRCILTEPVSCLHDYTLSVTQMRELENAALILENGLGLDAFLDDAVSGDMPRVTVSDGVSALPGEDGDDPHIWLDPDCAAIMAENIRAALTEVYPEQSDAFSENLTALLGRLSELKQYGKQQLSSLSCRKLITFHDGFAYFAQAFGLELLASMEEEHGSEIAASELIEIVRLVRENELPAIFTESYGSDAAAKTVQAETGVKIASLDMAMGDPDYFAALRQNIDTIREVLQ